jgi:hypothetical protein
MKQRTIHLGVCIAVPVLLTFFGYLELQRFRPHAWKERRAPRDSGPNVVMLYPAENRCCEAGYTRVREGSGDITFQLADATRANFQSFRVELTNETPQMHGVMWASDVVQQADATFVIVVPRGFIPSGLYRFVVYGMGDGPPSRLGSFKFRTTTW